MGDKKGKRKDREARGGKEKRMEMGWEDKEREVKSHTCSPSWGYCNSVKNYVGYVLTDLSCQNRL